MGSNKALFKARQNNLLLGMVSQCAGCNIYEPWAAFIIGSLAGPVFIGVRQSMIRLKIDDPLDAVGVHAGGGILGVILAPFFKEGSGIFWAGDQEAPWATLGINIAGVVTIMLWAGFWSIALFGSLKAAGMLRIDSETEFKGCDIVSWHPLGPHVVLHTQRLFTIHSVKKSTKKVLFFSLVTSVATYFW